MWLEGRLGYVMLRYVWFSGERDPRRGMVVASGEGC